MARLRSPLVGALALALFVPFLSYAPAAQSAPPTDDTPVLLTPKGEHENGEEEGGFDKLRDAYYWSDLLAGADGKPGAGVSVAKAPLAVKSKGPTAATPSVTSVGQPVGGAWAPQGNNPTVQVVRTSNTFAAMSGRVGALAVRNDGTIILGAAGGGVWTYDATTKTWTSRSKDSDTQPVGALATAPSDDAIVYMGSGEATLAGDSYSGDGVYRSSDGGLTWSHVSGNQFNGVSVSDIVVDPADSSHLYISTVRGRGGIRRTTHPFSADFGVWESTDAGAHWTLRKGTPDELHGATDLVMDPQNPKVLWASFWGDGIYRSTDGGLTWASALGNLPAGQYSAGGTRFSLGLSHPAAAAKATVYAGFDYFDLSGRYHKSQVYKTVDDGVTWAATATGSGTDTILDYCGTQCFYDNEVKPDPTDPNTVYVEGSYGYNFSPQSGGIFRSTDGGATWKSLGYDLHPDFHAVAFQPNNTKHVVIGNDGGVWQSFTGGGRNGATDPLSAADWEDLNGTVNPTTGALIHSTGLQIGQFVSIATVPQVPGQYWGGTQDNGTQRKSTVNTRWFDQAGGDGGQVIVDQTTPNPNSSTLPGYVFSTYYGISPNRYSPSSVGTFFGNEAIDGGITMTDRAEFYVPWTQNRGNVNQLFLGTYRLYRTDNAEAASAGDVTWAPVSGDLTAGCPGAAPNGARGCLISAIGVADGGDGVYVGTDDGVVQVSPDAVTSASPSWHQVGVGVLPNLPVSQIAVDRSNWRIAYVAYSGFGAGHVYKTSDGGAHWTNISSRLPDVPVNSIVLDPSNSKKLYIGTDAGSFVTTSGGTSWNPLGTDIPKVSVWQLDYDASHGVLLAGTHGRGAYTLQNPSPAPALVVSTADSGVPVGPGSALDYSITVRNLGNADATDVTVTDPVPTFTSFVSAGSGGHYANGTARWTGLTVPAGGSITLPLRVRIASSVPPSLKVIVDDGIVVKSAQGARTTGSPHTTTLAPAHALLVSPATQKGAAKLGAQAGYTVHLTNRGYLADSYALSTTSTWPAQAYDATCTTALATSPSVAPGTSTDICVKVTVPAGTADGATADTTLTATSAGDPSVTGTSTATTIAVAADVLLVDEDANGPDVSARYKAALGTTPYSYWDLAADPNIPQSLLTAHKTVIWWTGNSYPAPVTPYENELSAFLDGGGRLFLSGQDILDQAAGTTAFVKNYLHVNWDGTERQNDKATASVTAVAGNPVTGTLGTVPLDHSVLGANYEDQITPIDPAAAAFTDDTGAVDGLTVASGAYKVVFLAFPFEGYGTAANQSALMSSVLGYFGS